MPTYFTSRGLPPILLALCGAGELLMNSESKRGFFDADGLDGASGEAKLGAVFGERGMGKFPENPPGMR